ncbi:hypothetical protein Mp_8g16270 [Marchantia polymorpha subsp. ruderalis]|nr:hypothetical protein MARPO_0154s0037 [Marchantia polymorpha]BBN20081.1 hypothetical protein Mp_8g16270 [Marchantia polymorpha subsp. ruderalis]|eukprot:PTQ28812.1 hypothetical protein MARPO_0154s0037 [Marchantia polymorpha]
MEESFSAASENSAENFRKGEECVRGGSRSEAFYKAICLTWNDLPVAATSKRRGGARDAERSSGRFLPSDHGKLLRLEPFPDSFRPNLNPGSAPPPPPPRRAGMVPSFGRPAAAASSYVRAGFDRKASSWSARKQWTRDGPGPTTRGSNVRVRIAGSGGMEDTPSSLCSAELRASRHLLSVAVTSRHQILFFKVIPYLRSLPFLGQSCEPSFLPPSASYQKSEFLCTRSEEISTVSDRRIAEEGCEGGGRGGGIGDGFPGELEGTEVGSPAWDAGRETMCEELGAHVLLSTGHVPQTRA